MHYGNTYAIDYKFYLVLLGVRTERLIPNPNFGPKNSNTRPALFTLKSGLLFEFRGNRTSNFGLEPPEPPKKKLEL